MIISFSPKLLSASISVSRFGDVLTINGEEFDFAGVTEGTTLPAAAIDSEWIAGDVSRIDGVLHLTLRLPHGPNPSEAVAFPRPLVVMVDGEIDLPCDPPAEPEPMPEELPE